MSDPGQDREPLIEAVAGAYRHRDPYGAIRPHPAWHDLDEQARIEAFDAAKVNRAMEAALDLQGLSTTAHAVLARIQNKP